MKTMFPFRSGPIKLSHRVMTIMSFIILACQSYEMRQTPLHDAIHNNNEPAIRQLIEEGREINTVGNDNRTPLHCMVNGSDPSPLLEFLLKHHAQVNAKDFSGETPLHYAARNCTVQSLNLLLAYHADIEAKNQYGETPLHHSIGNNIDRVLFLLNRGAQLDVQNSRGETPLHNAVRKQDSALVQLLLSRGARTDIPNRKGKYPMDLAQDFENKALVGILQKYRSKKSSTTAIIDAITRNDVKALKQFIVDRHAVTAENSFGYTPLHYAAIHGNYEIADLLVNHGGGINTRGKNGMTPFHYALAKGNFRMVQLFLEKGANVQINGENNINALQYAIRGRSLDCMILILSRFANVDAVDDSGITALHMMLPQAIFIRPPHS